MTFTDYIHRGEQEQLIPDNSKYIMILSSSIHPRRGENGYFHSILPSF